MANLDAKLVDLYRLILAADGSQMRPNKEFFIQKYSDHTLSIAADQAINGRTVQSVQLYISFHLPVHSIGRKA